MSTRTLICYEGKEIIKYVYSLGGNVQLPQFFDVKVAGHLVCPEESADNFSELSKRLCTHPDYTIATECPLQKTAWYMTIMEDVWGSLNTNMIQNGLYQLFVYTEMKILPILADMEQRGVCVDVEKLDGMGAVLMKRMKEVERKCYVAAGKNFQINSSVQVRAILYEDLKLDDKNNIKIKKTITKGDKSTSEEMLRALSEVHPLPRLILEYRHLHKAHSTFITGIAHHVVNGVVKPTWDQSAAVTGRISSNNPNLQAIPKTFDLVLFPKDNDVPECLNFRSVYTSRPGYILVVADFKQVECRVFAHKARDELLEEALRSDDLFTVLAAKWMNKCIGTVSKGDRERTKRLVYAGMYGAGANKLADILQVQHGQVPGIIASFDATFPSLKRFCKSVWSECSRGEGRLSTSSGRSRTFPNIDSEDPGLRAQAQRQAVNFIIQGSAADVCKRAMCECVGAVPGRLLLTVHDELVWEVARPDVHEAAAIIKSSMEGCGRQLGLNVPLPVTVYTGGSWGDLDEYTHIGETG